MNPRRMTLFLKLRAPASYAKKERLQVEVFPEKRAILKDRPMPWYIRLDPLRLFLMKE